jgi:hypothetical protein
LQGAALNAMLEFFRCLVAAKVSGLAQKDLLALLVNPVMHQQGATIHKQVKQMDNNITKLVAEVVAEAVFSRNV